jgi:hypothetical protein
MVYSASISLADSPRFNVAPTHFLVRHLLSLGIASRRQCWCSDPDANLATSGAMDLCRGSSRC